MKRFDDVWLILFRTIQEVGNPGSCIFLIIKRVIIIKFQTPPFSEGLGTTPRATN